ncbi:MAG: class II aldolase/adducin family protein, partial [Sciscionella sp.]
LAVKASGSRMATATAEDFLVVDIEPLTELLRDPAATQQDLTCALNAGTVGGRHRQASIETLVHVAVHAVAPTTFIGHTHPTAVVGLMASARAESAFDQLVYSDEAAVLGRPLYVPYAQPGIALGRMFHDRLRQRHEETGELPALVLLGNHGIVAIAPTADGVDGISAMAVKGSKVRTTAYAVGGVIPLPDESVASFFAREDIAERRRNLVQGQF